MKLLGKTVALAGFLLVGCGPTYVEEPAALQQDQSAATVKEDGVTIQAPCCSSCDGICEYYGWDSSRCDSCWRWCSFSC